MAIYIKPKGDAEELLKKLIEPALATSKRRISTWTIVSQDGDFTHSTPDKKYLHKAYLKPRVEEGQVVLHLHWPANATPDSKIYAVYHGQFVEMVLTYFHDQVHLISVS